MDDEDRSAPADRQEEIRQQLRQLQSRNPRFRAAAARRLGDLRAEPRALLRALDDPNSFVRQAAAQALGYAAGDLAPEAIDGLLAAIDDPNDFVCAAAIRALGLLEAEEARHEILGFLDAHQPVIVQAAIVALGRLG